MKNEARLKFTRGEMIAVMRACLGRAELSRPDLNSAYNKLSGEWVKMQPHPKRTPCACRSAGHELCGA